MAKEMITVNGRNYRAKELDFNFLCALGEAGISINEIDKKMMNTLRVYVAMCMDVDSDVAGAEISSHIINGGTFEELAEIFSEKAESSDFFRALSERNGQDTTKKSTKRSPKKNAEQTEASE